MTDILCDNIREIQTDPLPTYFPRSATISLASAHLNCQLRSSSGSPPRIGNSASSDFLA